MKAHKLICLATGLALPILASAASKTDPEHTIHALDRSIAAADHAIRLVQAQEAVNLLSGALANAEMSIALAHANDAIRFGQGQDAINALTSEIAHAEVSIALANASELIDSVPDEQMLNELDATLRAQPDSADAMIAAVVSERPLLAEAVQGRALDAGLDPAMVAFSVVDGLGMAPATAAGKR